jgi:hypothetical protein
VVSFSWLFTIGAKSSFISLLFSPPYLFSTTFRIQPSNC